MSVPLDTQAPLAGLLPAALMTSFSCPRTGKSVAGYMPVAFRRCQAVAVGGHNSTGEQELTQHRISCLITFSLPDPHGLCHVSLSLAPV